MPSLAAASSIVAVAARMRRMCSASIWSSVSGSAATVRRRGSRLPICDGRCSSSTSGPEARITPRSIALRSSRMLPGHG